MKALGDSVVAPAGQSFTRSAVLREAADSPITVAEAARHLQVARQSVQRIADRLEREGFLTYHDNPADRRARMMVLTHLGHDTLDATESLLRAQFERVASDVGRARLLDAIALLDEVVRAVEEAQT